MLPHLPASKNPHIIFKAAVLALFLFFLTFPLPSRAILGIGDITFDPANLAQMIYENVVLKGWDLLKEHSGLLWKQTQVYFGTRLAQDAAIYLASGGKGQSSFIWNVSEIKELANATAGEYLDNLSKSYFGKSACQPGDLRTMVQIDLSARGLITGISNVRTRVCEEICQRTVMGTSAEITGAAGDAVSTGVGVVGLELTDFSKMREDLQAYSNSAKDLMKEITKIENEVRLGVGKYVWENVRYTFDVLNDMEDALVFMSDARPFSVQIGTGIERTFYDPQELRDYLFGDTFQSMFQEIIGQGVTVSYWKEQRNEATGVIEYVKEGPNIAEPHGEPFAQLVRDIFNAFYVAHPEAKEPNPYPWSMKDIDNFFKGNSVTAGLGLEALAKLVPPSLISFTFQSKYVSTDERQALLGDMFLALYQKEMGNIYSLFRANEELIKRKALLARPPNIPEISEILNLLQSSATVKAYDMNGDGTVDSDEENNPSKNLVAQSYANLRAVTLPNSLSPNSTISLYDVIATPFSKNALLDNLNIKTMAILQMKDDINKKYPDLKQFTDAFAKFNQCVQACESAKLKKPKGTCTLDKITGGEGVKGIADTVTGISGGVRVNVEGRTLYENEQRVGFFDEKKDEGDDGAQPSPTTRKRIQVEDLHDFATIAFPGQNSLGQVLDIALRTQGQSEEARRQAEVEAQAKDYKPKKSLISGNISVPGNQVGSRLDNALADVRAANNAYTDSVLAQMWGVFFNTLLKEFQEKLYDKGLDPKLYGGAFNPITRQAFGKGVAAAEKQLGQVFKPNITPGGVITTQILTNLTSGCEKPASKRRFDECIIDENFKQAIEQRLTLAKATCYQSDNKECSPYISLNSAFGYVSADGTEPQIQYGSGGAADSGQGIPYKSMIVLRKYRIIPASWEVAAVWIREHALKSRDGKPAPGKVTVKDVMDGFDDKTSAYYGLVNPNWVLKLPQYQCNRQGAGEEIITETPTENPTVTNADPFDVQITRADTYCADPISCIREKTDGTGCAEFGYCTAERDFWQFPSPTCQEINKTCQAYTAPNGKTVAYLEQSLDINNECDEASDGCTGFIRDYNYAKFTDNEGARVRGDGKSDTAFTFSPINKGTSAVNATGLIDMVPEAFQCTSLGRTCTYEQIAGRSDGCVLHGTRGVQCTPPNNIADVSADQRYWCGIPGGAGCFVGRDGVIERSGDTKSTAEPPLHTTIKSLEGKACALGRWDYDGTKYIFVPTIALGNKMTCSLYRDSAEAQAGTKRVYLNDNARPCKDSAAGCQQYYTIDFGRDEYTREFNDEPEKSYATFLTLDEKKAFVENLANRVFSFYKDKLLESQRKSFDYTQDIPLSEIMPDSLKKMDPKVGEIKFAQTPRITSIQLNANRVSCTEREVACRRYSAKGGGTVAAIINPRENQCPNECVGFERYREPLTTIEKKLGKRAIASEPLSFIDRYLIPGSGFECPNKSADAGCEKFIKGDNEEVIRMYLKDIRLCVNVDHKKADGEKANAVYTIIESTASGATKPVNVELLQSDFNKPIYYTVSDGKVIVSKTETGESLYTIYHGPCTFMDPDKNQGKPVQRWQCNDIFDDIKQHLERCLVLNDKGEPVTDLTKPDCREYIYFPSEGGGAERYPVPEDAPVYASPTCDVLKRGGTNGLAYPIDPQSQILKRFTCSESAVSCREYQGPGFQTNGALALDFEGSETRWVGEGSPEKALNVNGLEDQAIAFTAGKTYYFDILSIPKDTSTKQIYKGKSFVLTFWGKGSGDVKIALGSGTYDTEGKFTPTSKEISYFTLGAITGEWRSQISPQLSPVDGDQKSFLPTHLVITVPSNSSLTLDTITLTMSTSVYLLRNSIEPSGEDGWNTPKSCNTDFNPLGQTEPVYYEKGKDKDGNDVHPQLGCRAYTSDRDEPLAFKSYGLCRDEAVGCTAVVNTFNTRSPEGETFIPRGIDEAVLGDEAPKNTYIVPPDALEYVVVPNNKNDPVFCKREEVGCTLLGKETRDQTGKVIGFDQTARIDDPEAYAQGDASIACLVSENSCRLYKRNEDESPARFKEPGNRACEWLTDEQSPTKQKGWFRKIVDADGNVTDDYETCELAYEILDPSIDYKVPRAKGYCLEKSTGRPVLNPVGSGYYPTAWCDPSLIGKDLLKLDPSVGQHTNKVNTCLDYIDVNNKEGAIKDPYKINAGIVEAYVVCAPTPMSCDPKESQCTWYKDPLGEGLGKHYFQIHIDKDDAEGDCNGKVSDDAGCRLFNDTSVTEEPKLKYNAKDGRDGGTLDAAQMCQNIAGDDLNTDDTANSNDCDTNQLIEVERDRACGEWLACSSAIVTGKENETVCVERKPCNIAGGGECVNFVEDAKQSFESKELGDKSARDRVSRLSGYSNVGYLWSWCDPYSSDSIVSTDKKKTQCFSGRECVNESLLYKKPNTGVNCDTQVDTLDACKESVCQEGAYKGNACVNDKDCYSDAELLIKVEGEGCFGRVNSFCNSNGMEVSKPGFKPFDEIRETGSHADIANGDFENAFVDMESVQVQQGADLVRLFPAGWDTTSCGTNGESCVVARRYRPATVRGEQKGDVHSGKYALQITGKDVSATQIVENIIPATAYTISGWLKVPGTTVYSGIGIDELKADGKWVEENAETNTQTRCNLSWSGVQTHCLRSKETKDKDGKNGWQYFTTTFTTTVETRQFIITLKNRGGGGVFFDDIQLRAHLQVNDTTLVAPSCRLYPEADSLNCDARNQQGQRIRGWRGYCIEPDPRNSGQCLNWWPVDVIQGETNVLGAIEDAGYTGQAPLYYCAETMDKAPSVPLPRLVCLAKNDVSQAGAEIAFEACKIVALVSDPKPSFYTLSDDDWRIGVDANDFGPTSKDQGGQSGYKVRMLLSKGFEKYSGMDVGGLCVLNENGEFVKQGDPPNCLNGCFLVQGLGGWGESKKNLGIPTFFKKEGGAGGNAYGGCTWSKNGSNWSKCAQDIEKYYHKTTYFYFTATDISFDDDLSDDAKKAGCWEHDEGDRMYAVAKGYTSKSADPYAHRSVNLATDIIDDERLQYYPSGSADKESDSVENLEKLAVIFKDMTRKKNDTDSNYYLFDNFESVTRGRLNDETYISDQAGFYYFKNVRASIFRQSRPQQCRVLVQAVDASGRNKAWSEMVEKGSAPLPPPLSYSREDPKCSPYGAIPPVRSPLNIVLEPVNKEDKQTLPAVQVPLEIYNPENIENKDKSLICKESHRGEGFYACGGLCMICDPLKRSQNKGKFCLTDADCGGEPLSCRVAVVANTEPVAVAASNEKALVPNIGNEIESGLRRIQRVFAKVFEVWEWKPDLSLDADKLEKETGVRRGKYEKLSDNALNTATGTWGETQDIGNLALVCKRKDGSTIPNSNLIYGEGKTVCDSFPGCRSGTRCTPKRVGEAGNEYRDFDYCREVSDQSGTCPDVSEEVCEEVSPCIPYRNQYPNVKNIAVTGNTSGEVILQEGQRTVTLGFDITINPNQKPIKTIIVDWGDGAQTALSGLAWDAGHRIFKHTYAFYPENFSGRPSTCKKYPTTNGVYECRYRPRVKVVDNWGWCNGAKLVTENDSGSLKAGIAYVTTEVVPEALKKGITEEEGYSWGYYGGDCFRSASDSNNSVYTMQSWDYFPGIVKVLPGSARTVDGQPTVKISFFEGQTDVTADLLADGKITKGESQVPLKKTDVISVQIDCKDDHRLVDCRISASGPKLSCLGSLNATLRQYCLDNTACYANEFACQFEDALDWTYTVTAVDDAGQSSAPVTNPVPFVVE